MPQVHRTEVKKMKRNVVVMTSLAMVVVLVGLFVTGSVFAQDPKATPVPAPSTPAAPGMMGPRMGGFGLSKAITDLLGLTPGQLLDARAAGKTLLDIAKDKGITEQQLVDAIVADHKTTLDQAVKDSKMTQEQADWLLGVMKAVAPFQLTNPFAGKQGWGMGMGMMGLGMGLGGQWGPMGDRGRGPGGWQGDMDQMGRGKGSEGWQNMPGRGFRQGRGMMPGWRGDDDQGGGRGMGGRWGKPNTDDATPTTPTTPAPSS
jgi:hypothetical protein